MKITFIGTGSAFSKNHGNSSAIIEADGRKLLIDCGRTVPDALPATGMRWHDIDALYVSHAHADHAGGIEEFAFARMFIPPVIKPSIFGEKKMLEDLWSHTLSGGLQPGIGRTFSLTDYFEPTYVDTEFHWQGTNFRLLRVLHIMDSYGLYFTPPSGQDVMFTSDARFDFGTTHTHYEAASIIFQDCETSPRPSGVHAHYSDLRTLNDETRQKMWLYHYQDGNLPDAQADGFAGFVEKGQVFEL
jgi:glyoxylase-like metal-dependent hydrolase (beta-lactamase superfamily II)